MIIATSGHIDHGKTLLVKALTGIDTDRLPEEKNRGISIDLGYAYHKLDDEKVLGFVDVPGHEKFVRNMLAGVTGIDYALLVIAADDGPMPQTEEHLSILDLLGVSKGAVAITKIDRVEPKRIDEVITLTEILLDGTSLEGAEIFPVSAISRLGLNGLWTHLKNLEMGFNNDRRKGNFRLAIDRRFTVPGAGLVVTGNVFSGKVQIGDKLTLSPAGTEARVRGIHAQNLNADSGGFGQRCALNITGPNLQKVTIRRGDWLLDEKLHAPTRRFDTRIKLLKSELRALKHWTPVHLHIGAIDVNARVALLDGKEIAPGSSGYVQMVLDRPIGTLHGDRLILRDQSARRTIAGGKVIDPFAPARGRSKPERLATIAAMEVGEPEASITSLLKTSSEDINLSKFTLSRNMKIEDTVKLCSNIEIVVSEVEKERWGFNVNRWKSYSENILNILERRHREKPDEPGLAENNVRTSLSPKPSLPLFKAIISLLAADNKILITNKKLRLPGHQASFSTQDKKLWFQIRQNMEEEFRKPLSLHELAIIIGISANKLIAFMRRAAGLGFVIQVAKNRYLLPEAVKELATIVEALATEDNITPAEFRNQSKIGRNMAVEILEFFDKSGLTKRDGNSRKIIKPAKEIFGS